MRIITGTNSHIIRWYQMKITNVSTFPVLRHVVDIMTNTFIRFPSFNFRTSDAKIKVSFVVYRARQSDTIITRKLLLSPRSPQFILPILTSLVYNLQFTFKDVEFEQQMVRCPIIHCVICLFVTSGVALQ